MSREILGRGCCRSSRSCPLMKHLLGALFSLVVVRSVRRYAA